MGAAVSSDSISRTATHSADAMASAKSGRKVGSFDLEGADIKKEDRVTDGETKHRITIKSKAGRVYTITAKTLEDRDAWLAAFVKARDSAVVPETLKEVRHLCVRVCSSVCVRARVVIACFCACVLASLSVLVRASACAYCLSMCLSTCLSMCLCARTARAWVYVCVLFMCACARVSRQDWQKENVDCAACVAEMKTDAADDEDEEADDDDEKELDIFGVTVQLATG